MALIFVVGGVSMAELREVRQEVEEHLGAATSGIPPSDPGGAAGTGAEGGQGQQEGSGGGSNSGGGNVGGGSRVSRPQLLFGGTSLVGPVDVCRQLMSARY